MILPDKDKEIEISQESAKRIFRKGQKYSNWTESLTIGFAPLILLLLNIATAVLLAHFVAWFLEHIPYAFWKVLMFTLSGAMCAIFLPSRLSFVFQFWEHRQRLKKDKMLKPEYSNRIIKNASREIWRNLFLALVAAALIVTQYIIVAIVMYTAFTDADLMENLGVDGGELTSMLVGTGIALFSAGIDVLLGLTTRVRADVTRILPDLDEEKELLQKALEYEKLQDEIQAVMLKVAEYGEARLNGGADTSGSGSSSGKHSGKGGSTEGGKYNRNKPPTNLEKIHEIRSQHAFLEEVFKGSSLTESKLTKAIMNAPDAKYQAEVASPLAQSVRKLRNLYKQGCNQKTWKKSKDTIWKNIQDEKDVITKVLKKINFHIRYK